jgi:hypothetical protein
MIGTEASYNAVFDVLIPKFFEGNIPQVIFLRVYVGYFNMGGPQMLLTLIPLFLVLILGGLYIRKLLCQEKLSVH